MSDRFNLPRGSPSHRWIHSVTPHSKAVSCQNCFHSYAIAFHMEKENLWLPQRLALDQAVDRHELECWGYISNLLPQSKPDTDNHVWDFLVTAEYQKGRCEKCQKTIALDYRQETVTARTARLVSFLLDLDAHEMSCWGHIDQPFHLT